MQSLSLESPVCNTLLYSSHSLIRYHDCSIREYRFILAIIMGHYICTYFDLLVSFKKVHFNRQVPDKNPVKIAMAYYSKPI